MPHSEPWRARAADAIGHHANEILIASIVAVVVLLGFKPLPDILGLTVLIALFGLVLLTWGLMRQHDRRLCEQCMLSTPLNAAEHAARYKRRFWMAHTGSEPRFFLPYLIVLVGSNFATSPIGRICWAVVQLSLVYVVLSYATHRKFQPWCPRCHDGGGEHVEDMPPVLTPDDRRDV